MRPGGGKGKGSEFERQVGKALSLWVSEGHRSDLFARNVLSGGSFTNAMKKDSKEHGMPGDLAANHPMAFKFLELFTVECKHYADLGFEAFLFDTESKSFLGSVLKHTRKQAEQAKLHPMVIARQNRRPSILLTDLYVGDALLEAVPARLKKPSHHILHSGRTTMLLLDEVVRLVPAIRFLEYMQQKRRG